MNNMNLKRGKYGQVPRTIPRWISSEHWTPALNAVSHPDRARDQDTEWLNLSKEQYVKDPTTDLEERYQEKMEIEQTILNLIRSPFVVKKGIDGEEETFVMEKVAAKKKYLVIHFSHCYKLKNFYYPAEFSVAEFSVYNGLGNGLQGLIDIGSVPLGYQRDVRDRMKETCNPYPPYNDMFDPYVDALQKIENLARRHFDEGETILMFTLKEYVPNVVHGLVWLFENTGKFLDIRILPLSELGRALCNESQLSQYTGNKKVMKYSVEHESYLDEHLQDTFYAYSPELACEFHARSYNGRGIEYCSENIVKRLIFNCFRIVSPFFGMTMQRGSHFPVYLKPIVRAEISDGIKVINLPNMQRMAEIQRFGSSDRLVELLRAHSNSGLTSSESSMPPSPDRSDSAHSLTDSGSGSSESVTEFNFSDLSAETFNTVELEPLSNSEKILSPFRVDLRMEGMMGIRSRQRQSTESVLFSSSSEEDLVSGKMPGNYSNGLPRFEDQNIDRVVGTPPLSPAFQPKARGRGRGLRALGHLTETLIPNPQPPDMKYFPRLGQFDPPIVDLPVPRRRPLSKCFDNLSTAGSLGSTRSNPSQGSGSSGNKSLTVCGCSDSEGYPHENIPIGAEASSLMTKDKETDTGNVTPTPSEAGSVVGYRSQIEATELLRTVDEIENSSEDEYPENDSASFQALKLL